MEFEGKPEIEALPGHIVADRSGSLITAFPFITGPGFVLVTFVSPFRKILGRISLPLGRYNDLEELEIKEETNAQKAEMIKQIYLGVILTPKKQTR